MFALALCLCMALTACAPAAAPEATATPTQAPAEATPAPVEEPAAYQAGSYTAAAKGKNGDIVVETVFDDNSIVSVTIQENAETAHIFRAVAERVPADIVENQSLNIEAVSGATISRGAILSAVADCVAQAGGDVEALKTKELPAAEKNADSQLETQVLVVGSGIAGLGRSHRGGGAGRRGSGD